MESAASDIARRLAQKAEAVCRHYLSNGRRQGRYWIVGDTQNTPGRSLYVRLTGPSSGPGAAGKWTDAATSDHGDLLDLITANLHLSSLGEALDEARRFLSLPRPEPPPREARPPAPTGSPEAARRLWAMGRPLSGTLAERYLAQRGIVGVEAIGALRFHPRCYYWREDRRDDSQPETWPALLARVTDTEGSLTGLHRTWLDPATADKAPVDPPRKAMGQLLGHGVRIGGVAELLAAGEGLETMLALRMALPGLPVVAALSAAHLAALILPLGLRRLYIAADSDAAGRNAADSLAERAAADGIDTIRLTCRLGDVNEDLRAMGLAELRAHLRPQLAPEDVDSLRPPTIGRRTTDQFGGPDRAIVLRHQSRALRPSERGETEQSPPGPATAAAAPFSAAEPQGFGFASRGKTAPPPPSSADAPAAARVLRCRPGRPPLSRLPGRPREARSYEHGDIPP